MPSRSKRKRRPPQQRAKNQMSVAAARAVAQDSQMKPKEWEKAVGMILKVNGWEAWQDVDRSNPKENARRQSAHPDWECHKLFESLDEVPTNLRAYAGLYFPEDMLPHPFAIWGYIECKTGTATATEGQRVWLKHANRCPGMFGVLVWPTSRAWLVDLLGGVEIIR